MIDTIAQPTLTLRSLDTGWNYARWEQELPDDGNRYEIIEGVLYMTTAPSYFRQWIIRRLDMYSRPAMCWFAAHQTPHLATIPRHSLLLRTNR